MYYICVVFVYYISRQLMASFFLSQNITALAMLVRRFEFALAPDAPPVSYSFLMFHAYIVLHGIN